MRSKLRADYLLTFVRVASFAAVVARLVRTETLRMLKITFTTPTTYLEECAGLRHQVYELLEKAKAHLPGDEDPVSVIRLESGEGLRVSALLPDTGIVETVEFLNKVQQPQQQWERWKPLDPVDEHGPTVATPRAGAGAGAGAAHFNVKLTTVKVPYLGVPPRVTTEMYEPTDTTRPEGSVTSDSSGLSSTSRAWGDPLVSFASFDHPQAHGR